LKIVCEKRIDSVDFVTSIRLALKKYFGNETVGKYLRTTILLLLLLFIIYYLFIRKNNVPHSIGSCLWVQSLQKKFSKYQNNCWLNDSHSNSWKAVTQIQSKLFEHNILIKFDDMSYVCQLNVIVLFVFSVLGGVILIENGKVKVHVCPDYSKTPLDSEKKLKDWLKIYDLPTPLVCLGYVASHDAVIILILLIVMVIYCVRFSAKICIPVNIYSRLWHICL
jgi:hypothetical protein